MNNVTIKKFKWKNNLVSEMGTYDFASRALQRAAKNRDGESTTVQVNLTHDSVIIPFIIAMGGSKDIWGEVNKLYGIKETDENKDKMIPYASYVRLEYYIITTTTTTTTTSGEKTEIITTDNDELNWITTDQVVRMFVNGINVTHLIEGCPDDAPCNADVICKHVG